MHAGRIGLGSALSENGTNGKSGHSVDVLMVLKGKDDVFWIGILFREKNRPSMAATLNQTFGSCFSRNCVLEKGMRSHEVCFFKPHWLDKNDFLALRFFKNFP